VPVEQRRSFVRDHVPGKTRITGPGIVDDLTGAVTDLGEGGVRLLLRGRPTLPAGWVVRSRTTLDGGGPVIDLSARVLRVDDDEGRWHVALAFPQLHPYMDHVRSVVFARQRRLLRSRREGRPD
jgi:hypothetical protein